ncbi:MAG: hypothetical protein R3E68_06785 [Burkholderiaceae bacterium]
MILGNRKVGDGVEVTAIDAISRPCRVSVPRQRPRRPAPVTASTPEMSTLNFQQYA